MGDSLLVALALMLVVEGLLPLLNPGGWRQLFARLMAMSDGQLRFLGLASVCVGLLMLALFRG